MRRLLSLLERWLLPEYLPAPHPDAMRRPEVDPQGWTVGAGRVRSDCRPEQAAVVWLEESGPITDKQWDRLIAFSRRADSDWWELPI